jgi:Family of unknown function (DUF5681)
MLKDNERNAALESDPKVGYGKPPQSSRFRKGSSGNPKGRPKGSRNVATVLARTLRERVVINEHGRRRRITKLEAALTQLANKGASGDLRAVQLLVTLSREAEGREGFSTERQIVTDPDQRVIDGIVRRFQSVEKISAGGKSDDDASNNK